MAEITLLTARSVLKRRRKTAFVCLLGAVFPSVLILAKIFEDSSRFIQISSFVVLCLCFLVATWYLIDKAEGLASLALFCPHCGKHIASSANWECSYCNTDHTSWNTTWYSFLHQCRLCGQKPKALICPHCQKVNYLDPEKDDRHPAKIVISVTTEPVTDSAIDKQKARLERKAELEHEIEVTRLVAQLEELKSSPIFKKEVADQEGALSKRFTQFEKHTIGVHMFAKKKRKEFEEQFKDDPEFLEQMNEALTSFVEDELISTSEEKK